MELEVLERWRERDVFRASLRARAGAQQWGFYEGPPTANGPPGSHHVLSRVFKDIFPRYKTMRGYYVERKGGWDCHGLPVELAVEAELGFTRKEDIERYGIAEFNARSRNEETVFVLAKELVARVLGDGAEIADAFPGAELEGTGYEPPFPFIAASAYGERGHTVLPADFVTAEDGTGLVHTAIAFGEDDFRLGEQQGLNVINPVLPNGTFSRRIGPHAGRWVKDADPDLIEDLRARDRLLRSEPYEHS